MTSPARPPLWAGRALALVGIALLALNLRTAVAAVSPITGSIAEDLPLDELGIGLLGMLPPVAFAVSGVLAPIVARRLGLEVVVLASAVAMVLGHLLRAGGPGLGSLFGGSLLVFAGMGFGNILLPPVVKRYFSDRLATLTTVYTTVMSVSTFLPPLVAAPIADTAGWRTSLAVWAAVAVLAVLPWIVLVVRHRRALRREAADPSPELPTEAGPLLGRMAGSPTAWAVAAVFAVSAMGAYAVFAWLPELLIETAGVSEIAAGSLLSLFALVGLPVSLVVPALASRMRRVGILVLVGVGAFVAGWLGLLLAPASATVLWVVLVGLGPLLFPVALFLINDRTRDARASIALSGFVQTVGYTAGATGPLLFGLLHSATGGWATPMIVLSALTLVAVPAALVLNRGTVVEDELLR